MWNCFYFVFVNFAKHRFFFVFQFFEFLACNRAIKEMRHYVTIMFSVHVIFKLLLGVRNLILVKECLKSFGVIWIGVTNHSVHIKNYTLLFHYRSLF